MALSNNMHALLDGTLNVGKRDLDKRDPDDDTGNRDEKVGNLKGGRNIDDKSKSVFADQQGHNEEEEAKGDKSLYIFSRNNPLRKFLGHIITNQYFPGFIYHMIFINSLLLLLDEPAL